MKLVLYMYVPAYILLVFVCTMQYHIGICMNLYEFVCISDVNAGPLLVQDPAGTSASERGRHTIPVVSHVILIPNLIQKMFCTLHAGGDAMKPLKPRTAWLQNCAAACGRVPNLQAPSH